MASDDGEGVGGGPRPCLSRGGVVAGEHPVNPEAQERHGGGHGLAQGIRVLAGEVARVGTHRQRGHGHIEAVALLPGVEPLGGVLARGVSVEGEHDPSGVAAKHPDVVLGQCGATRGDGVVKAYGGKPDGVGVALAHDGFVSADDGGLCPVEAVEGAALVVHGAVGGVLVLRSLCPGKHPPPEGHGFARCTEDGKQDPATKRVRELAPGVHKGKARLNEEVPGGAEAAHQDVPALRRPAQLEVSDLVAGESPAAQVGAGRRRVGFTKEALVVEGNSVAQHVVEAGALLAGVPLPGVGVAEGEAAHGCQLLHCAHEVQVIDLSHEGDDVTFGAAPKAVEEALFGVHGKRRRLLTVEGAQSREAAPDPLELHVLADDRDDIGALPHPGDVLVDDPHCASLSGANGTSVRGATCRGPPSACTGTAGSCYDNHSH